MRRRRAVIGGPAVRLHLRFQPLELAAADVFEVPAGGRPRGFFIEVDGNPEARRDLGRHVICQPYAILHRHAFDRHERHDVHGAEPRVLAAMRAEIDRADRFREEREDGGLQRRGVTREREHGSVVRPVGRIVEQPRAIHVPNRRGEPLDDVAAPPFTHVRNALDHGHENRF